MLKIHRKTKKRACALFHQIILIEWLANLLVSLIIDFTTARLFKTTSYMLLIISSLNKNNPFSIIQNPSGLTPKTPNVRPLHAN